jgi:hypothetical protein
MTLISQQEDIKVFDLSEFSDACATSQYTALEAVFFD